MPRNSSSTGTSKDPSSLAASSNNNHMKDKNNNNSNTASSVAVTTTIISPHPWARIRKRSAAEAVELAHQTSTQTSEYRLRLESMQWWQRHLQAAQTIAWQRLVAPTLEECRDFLECSSDDVNVNDGSRTEEDENEQEITITSAANNSDGADSTTNTSNTVNNNNNNNEWWRQFCLPLQAAEQATECSESTTSQCSIRYPPEVLPIMIIHSPLSASCLMDRQYLATTVWREWNKSQPDQPHHPDVCVFLPRLLPTLTDTLHLLADALTTTLKKKSPPHYYQACSHLLSSGRKKRKRTLQSSIQEWIMDVLMSLPEQQPCNNNTNQYRIVNLVIVLQDDVPGSTTVKRQFMQTLTSWRNLQGVPVSLVILSSSIAYNSLSMLIRRREDGASGRFGYRVLDLAVPKAKAASSTLVGVSQAVAVWSQYFFEALQETPIPLSPFSGSTLPLYQWIQESILETVSCTRMVTRLDGLVSEFFSQPGSFVWDSLRRVGNREYQARTFQPAFCAWFCVYEKAQSMLSNRGKASDPKTLSSTLEKCGSLLECRQLLQPGGQVYFWWRLSCAILPLQVWAEISDQNGGVTMGDNTDFILACLGRAFDLLLSKGVSPCVSVGKDDDEGARVLCRYLQRQAPSVNGCPDDTSPVDINDEGLKDASRIVGDLIILVDRMSTTRENGQEHDGIDTKAIWKGLTQMILDGARLVSNRLDHWTHNWLCTNPLMKWIGMEAPDLAKNYSHIPVPRILNIRRNVVAGLSPVAQKLLAAMQDQMTITQDDWFRSFDGPLDDFCIGIWTLQMIGLIQIKKRTTKVMYEKVSVVWT